MGRLTAKSRNALLPSAFVFPGKRSFPVPDISHARNALSQAAKKGPAVAAKVRAVVKRRFPAIGKGQ